MADKKVMLTEEGYNKLVDKVNYLKSVRRIEIAERLKAAGVKVKHKRYDNLAHAFTAFTFLSPGSRAACAEIARMVHDFYAAKK